MSVCGRARTELARFVDRLSPNSVADVAESGIKAGYLASLTPAGKGFLGNTSWAGVYKTLFQQPTEAAFDQLQSTVRSAATGFKIKPHEFREVVSALDLDGLAAGARGVARGSREVGGAVKRGIEKARGMTFPPGTPFAKTIAERFARAADEVTVSLNTNAQKLGINTPTQVRVQGNVKRALIEAPFSLVEAVDRPALEGAYDMSMYMQSKLSAVRQNLKGAARKAEIDRLMASPTLDMEARALEDALYATFKDKTALSDVAESVRRTLTQGAMDGSLGHAALKVGMALNIPFTGVPSSILAKGVSMTPLGVLSPKLIGNALGNAAKRAKAAGRTGKALERATKYTATQATRSRAMANVALGTPLMALGYYGEQQGWFEGMLATGNARDDQLATRAANAAKMGGKWVVLTELGPLAVPMLVGAALSRLSRTDPDAGMLEQASVVAGAAGKAIADNPFAQGTAKMAEAFVDPAGPRGQNFVASNIAGLVPSGIGQIANVMDGKEREAQGMDRVKARIPGLRETLPEKGTPFGRQREKSVMSRLSPMLPVRITDDRSTPVTQELRRAGVSVGTPSREVTVRGEKVTLEPDRYNEVVERQGEFVNSAVQRLMASPVYQALPDEEKKRRLRLVVDRAKDRARTPAARDAARLLQN
jgi:hypothetical protein